tara:strand:+ start:207 stop:368 length:162 start_codon:yes stop_codon:yes gene_type:complete
MGELSESLPAALPAHQVDGRLATANKSGFFTVPRPLLRDEKNTALNGVMFKLF